jgi:hypothetical protein
VLVPRLQHEGIEHQLSLLRSPPIALSGHSVNGDDRCQAKCPICRKCYNYFHVRFTAKADIDDNFGMSAKPINYRQQNQRRSPGDKEMQIDFHDLLVATSVLVGFQVTLFIWRIDREVEKKPEQHSWLASFASSSADYCCQSLERSIFRQRKFFLGSVRFYLRADPAGR